MGSGKVLIVDDEESILRSTSALLEDMGFATATCSRADDIVTTLERERPDVLLQDLRMPGLDLEKLVQRLRSDPRWKRLPLVIFTASMDAEDIGERVGAFALLDKPFRPSELDEVLSRALVTVRA